MSETMSTPAPAKHVDCDVLVVGSGPSGAVFAKRAAEAGMSVVCLEQGDWVDYSKAISDKAGFELTAPRDWQYVPTKRDISGDFPISVEDSDIIPLYWNGVGGSSISWAANWMRNLPSDFRVRSLDGVADDWPITYQDLLPHYARTEREFVVSGVAGDPHVPWPGRASAPGRPYQSRTAGRRRAQSTWLALVARHQCNCHRAAQRHGTLPAAHRLHVGLHREGQGVDRPDALAGIDRQGRAPRAECTSDPHRAGPAGSRPRRSVYRPHDG